MLLDIHEPGESPDNNKNGATIGIDLGTTNSLVAIANKGVYEVISDEDGNFLLPSIVEYLEDGSVKVGDKSSTSTSVIRSVKRLMGKSSDDVKTLDENDIYNIVEKNDDNIIYLNVGKKDVTPVEVSAEILKELKKRAEKELSNDVENAVITVPAYFDDAARQSTKDAAKLAGIEVLRLVNEPTAAALCYGLDKEAEGIYAIYDLGGGTFDVSILKMEKGVFQVIATGGDTLLGGDDFDNKIAKYIIKEYINDVELSSEDFLKIIKLSREIKEFLSENASGNWEILISDKNYHIKFDRELLANSVSDLVDRTINTFSRVLIDSDIKRDELKGVVLVGGSTRMPVVREKLNSFIGEIIIADIDPDKVVAIGSAIQAESLTQGNNTLLIDVTPLSLGLETYGGLVEVVIHRNTPIPCSASQKFTTFKDGQTGLKIHVLQGEREMVDQCRSLAQFDLNNIPPMKAGAAIIEVTFMMDSDGLLTVSAKEEVTGTEQHIEVKPSYGLPSNKIEEMLIDSMNNAKDDIMRRLLAEAKVDADITITAIESALESDSDLLTAEEYKDITSVISDIKQLMLGDDRDELDIAVKHLDKITGTFAEKRVNKSLGEYLEGESVNEFAKKL